MIKPPSAKTLKKYGLSEKEWLAILERQGGTCAVCRKLPPSGRLVVDHDHVHRWKHLKPEIRKLHVRGLLCWLPCNRYYVGRGITVEKSRNVTDYLEGHCRRVAAEMVG